MIVFFGVIVIAGCTNDVRGSSTQAMCPLARVGEDWTHGEGVCDPGESLLCVVEGLDPQPLARCREGGIVECTGDLPMVCVVR